MPPRRQPGLYTNPEFRKRGLTGRLGLRMHSQPEGSREGTPSGLPGPRRQRGRSCNETVLRHAGRKWGPGRRAPDARCNRKSQLSECILAVDLFFALLSLHAGAGF